jgi:hypothetical protein
MVKVYAESNCHAELIAVFPNEEVYDACSDALDRYAAKARMIITESVEEEEECVSF